MATWRPGSPDSSDASRPDRFRLSGPSRLPDPRINAYRRDVADVRLAGMLFAPHYARPQCCAVQVAAVALRAAPDNSAAAVSQLLAGETFETLEITGGWAWGSCAHDGYVGYLPADALAAPHHVTHRVTAVRAPLFAAADIKSPVASTWPIGACFAGRVEGDFLATGQGYLHARHAAPINARVTDPVATAERLLGQSYLWGGRGGDGVDCSGLVQLALGFAGIAAPRDSDQQREVLGRELADGETLQRGDLIFFPGHVGLMIDGDRLIHANAHWMAVVIEPLADVVTRVGALCAEPILARRRVELP